MQGARRPVMTVLQASGEDCPGLIDASRLKFDFDKRRLPFRMHQAPRRSSDTGRESL